jgi:glycosyltransferase involved in cell wall biosynthesis
MKAIRKSLGSLRIQTMGVYQRWIGIPFAYFMAGYRQADISIFFDFKPAPYGGGNQFLRASLHRDGCRMIHRVDGPLGVYRGHNDGSDARIWEINQELADATIFQSNYSMQKHLELGMEFISPCVILNTCDPHIFHPDGRAEFDPKRKLRLISTSWSPNPNKGAPVYKWIEEHLDWKRFDYTFVGNSPIQFERIHMIPPQPSRHLAGILRQHDIFITATKYDSCSNALLEALSCGLPALFLNSGGSPEIVRQGGIGFDENSQILERLDQLVREYLERQALICPPSLEDVTDEYLNVMEIET